MPRVWIVSRKRGIAVQPSLCSAHKPLQDLAVPRDPSWTFRELEPWIPPFLPGASSSREQQREAQALLTALTMLCHSQN